MKILLDANIITLDNIHLLLSNKIKKLISSNQLTFYLSVELLLQRFIPLIHSKPSEYERLIIGSFEVCDERIFTSIEYLLQKELRDNIKGKYYFCSLTQGKILRNNFLNKTIGKNEIEHVKNSLAIKEIARKKNIELNKTLINSDLTILKKGSSPYLIDDWEQQTDKLYQDFPDYLNNIHNYIKEETLKYKTANNKILYKHFVESILRVWNAKTIIKTVLNKEEDTFKNWFYNRSRFPYLTNFLEAMVFQSTDNIVGKHIGFDKDADHDNVYICYMTDLDILLSNDTKYMKKCFNYVYKDTKQILTMDELLVLIENS